MRKWIVVGVSVAAAGVASAGTVPTSERFTLERRGDAIVRLDRTSGAMSLCTIEQTSGLVCRLSTDERAAFEAKVTALTDELKATKDALQALRDKPEDLAGPAEAKPKGFVELLLARMIHSARRSDEGKAEPAPKAR